MHDTRQRITALALIYRALYQSPDLREVDVRQFLEELIAQVVQGEASSRGGLVRTELTADDLEIDPDKLAPLALYAVEALTQARKAVAASGGTIHIRFVVTADDVTLEIADEGGTETRTDPGDVGKTLMTAYARQLRGRSALPRRRGRRPPHPAELPSARRRRRRIDGVLTLGGCGGELRLSLSICSPPEGMIGRSRDPS